MQPTPVSATCFQHQPPAPEGSQQLPDGLFFSSCWSVSQSLTIMVSCVVPLHHFSLLAGSKVQPSAWLWKHWVSSSPDLPPSCVLPLCLLLGHRQLPRLARPHSLLCLLGLHTPCFLCSRGFPPWLHWRAVTSPLGAAWPSHPLASCSSPGWHVQGEAPSPVPLPSPMLDQQPGGAYGHLAGVL